MGVIFVLYIHFCPSYLPTTDSCTDRQTGRHHFLNVFFNFDLFNICGISLYFSKSSDSLLSLALFFTWTIRIVSCYLSPIDCLQWDQDNFLKHRASNNLKLFSVSLFKNTLSFLLTSLLICLTTIVLNLSNLCFVPLKK